VCVCVCVRARGARACVRACVAGGTLLSQTESRSKKTEGCEIEFHSGVDQSTAVDCAND
jgi:hypothetical protein